MYKKPNPIKQLIEKGKMLSSAKGSSNYMKKDPKSPLPITGKKNTFYSDQVDLMSDKKTGNVDVDATNRASVGITNASTSNYNSMFQDGLPAEKTTNKIKSTPPKPSSAKNNKKTKKKQTPKSTPKDNTPSAAQTAASKLEQRAKTAISKRKKAPKTKDGVNAVIEHQNKKKAASKIKDTKTKSKAEIRSAKTTAKQAGKSKQEIRLAKTKAKAKNARIETTSKETAAQGGKKAQEKRAKTIRLEKRAKRIEGRRAKRKAKK
jgi:hypothetical protein